MIAVRKFSSIRSKTDPACLVEALLDPHCLSDAAAARAYGLVYAATRARHRKPHGARAVDLLITATALANGLPLFTRNPGDFDDLEAIGLEVLTV